MKIRAWESMNNLCCNFVFSSPNLKREKNSEEYYFFVPPPPVNIKIWLLTLFLTWAWLVLITVGLSIRHSVARESARGGGKTSVKIIQICKWKFKSCSCFCSILLFFFLSFIIILFEEVCVSQCPGLRVTTVLRSTPGFLSLCFTHFRCDVDRFLQSIGTLYNRKEN